MKGLAGLEEREKAALAAGGAARVARQHAAGKLTARERLARFLDPGSFREIGAFVGSPDAAASPGEGVVTGVGAVDGRTVAVYSQDFTVHGGSLSSAHARKIVRVTEYAEANGAPIVGLCDSGGARIQEGVASLGGYGDVFLRNVRCSGVVPQISVVLGPCAGGAVYSPALTDFVVMAESTANMFVTGPDVVRAVTGESVTKESLGGAAVHAGRSGVVHFAEPDEDSCLARTRELLSYLPSSASRPAPWQDTGDPPGRPVPELAGVVPDDPTSAYDVRRVITAVADGGRMLETQAAFAPNIVTGFVRLAGHPTGVVANQPSVLAGCLDIDASVKAGRFVRFCDAFGIPLLTLVDVPGFLPGTRQEHGGVIRHGAKLLYAYAEATVPKVTVILRKAYGGAYDVMGSKHLGADANFAYPGAEIAVMGADGAVDVLHRGDPAAASPADRAALVADYRARHCTPWDAAALGFVDKVIRPEATRDEVTAAFALFRGKQAALPRRKHGNPPL